MAKGKLRAKLASARNGVKGRLGRASEAARESGGISPDPSTNLILADIALRGGSTLLRRGIERGLLGRTYPPEKAAHIVRGRSMGQALIGTAIAKVATRSVPGAIIVGGGLLAKTLFDWRKDRKLAKHTGEAALHKMAVRGSSRDS